MHSCNRDLRRAQGSLWIQWPILTLLSLSTSFAGLVLYAQYYLCDPMKSGRISNSDQVHIFLSMYICMYLDEDDICIFFVLNSFDYKKSEYAFIDFKNFLNIWYLKTTKKFINIYIFFIFQLLPLYVVETMGMIPGLSGLFVSGIFSGSLSTVSSALNSLAAVTVQDYILVGADH